MERTHVSENTEVAEQKAALERVLRSAEFQASPQSRRFLEYATGRLFSGDAQIEQADIAREVLERGDDFDPTTDASVRKLAMQVRQRLERYYSGAGSGDRVSVVLPLRCYVPQFQMREPGRPGDAPGRRARWLPWGIAAAAAAALGLAWLARTPAPESGPGIRIVTQRGDITAPKPDNAPGSLRLFREVGANEDVVTRLTFRPDRERQHAGVVIWEGPRRFVSLGRRFSSRNYVTFGYEYDNYMGSHPVSEVDDPDAQSGRPLWLRLHHGGDTYSAFTSLDGREWRPVGEPLRLPHPLRNARGGIFAVNGRRESPSIPAEFEWLGIGLALPASAGEGPWKFESDCPQGPDLFAGARPAPGEPPCAANWLRPAPAGTWTVSTRLEMPANPAVVAGLLLQGAKGRVRLLRYPSDLPTISLLQDGVSLESIPDFPGSPPVFLRLAIRGGRIEGSASVDGREYRTVGKGIPLAQLGKVSRVGLTATRRPGLEQAVIPPLRVFFIGVDTRQ